MSDFGPPKRDVSGKISVLVCVKDRGSANPSCGARGAKSVLEALSTEIATRGLDVEVRTIPCFGHCTKGPNVRVLGGGFCHGVSPSDLGPVFEAIEQKMYAQTKKAEA